MGFFRPESVEFAVRVVSEQARVVGKCALRALDEYCNHTRSKRSLSPWCTLYFLRHIFRLRNINVRSGTLTPAPVLLPACYSVKTATLDPFLGLKNVKIAPITKKNFILFILICIPIGRLENSKSPSTFLT